MDAELAATSSASFEIKREWCVLFNALRLDLDQVAGFAFDCGHAVVSGSALIADANAFGRILYNIARTGRAAMLDL